ncbi:MAG TPA: hypothetical protein VK166_16885 [Chitinophagaceae bacterium]|nr:hypothetical protein [Chitinophagaceae bacterium]
MKAISLIVILMAFSYQQGYSQGCVAIRSAGGMSCSMDHATADSSGWMLYMNNRYFKSYKHFVGTEEQEERVENGTEVINHSYSMDIFLIKNINHRWSVGVNLPILANTRSSLYEHGGNAAGPSARHSTHSFGIGDMRVAVYRWLLDPRKHMNFNVQAGIGLKLPTGDYQYEDYFYKNDSVKVNGPVDQSIQLGDGGTGITTEINTFWNINRMFSVYGNFYYLMNPREQNGVSTARGGVPNAQSISYGSNVMSVADQWMFRAGVNYRVNRFTASLGYRREEIPVYDAFGGSNGFRRPGYVESIEPGLVYQMRKMNIYAFVPVAIVRNRTQSVPDKIRSEKTGKYYQGDAAFADYAINIGFNIKL